jgi:hypothetical protein
VTFSVALMGYPLPVLELSVGAGEELLKAPAVKVVALGVGVDAAGGGTVGG